MPAIQDETRNLFLMVTPDSLERFTTLLQSGVIFTVEKEIALGVFLESVTGFSQDYIVERIQTIFLDGNAVDDLEVPLTKKDTVIAVSAAMPGLAGAIFRKNSLHSALRSSAENKKEADAIEGDTIHVTLKLFNMIAKEKGEKLLKNGVNISGKAIHTFLSDRPSLFSHIHHIQLDTQMVYPDTLLEQVDTGELFSLKVDITND